MKKYLTVAAVNRMIPDLERAFQRMIQLRVQVRPLLERLSATGHAPADTDFAPLEGAEDIPPEVVDDLTTLRALVDGIQSTLEELGALGCMVKSIDQGLVDWYARDAEGRDVLLCWKLGEKRVEYWHHLSTGFAGRRPVAELPPETLGEG